MSVISEHILHVIMYKEPSEDLVLKVLLFLDPIDHIVALNVS